MKLAKTSVCLIVFIAIYVTSTTAIRIWQSFAPQLPGEECTLPHTFGKKGICQPLKTCPDAKCQRKKLGVPYQRCGVHNGQLTVCCDRERKSVRVCRAYRESIDKKPLIVNGIVAKPGEFPHMVLITFRQPPRNVRKSCGGSLITEKYVISAAHCFLEPSLIQKTMRVYLGGDIIPLDDLDDESISKLPNVVTRTVTDIIIHPKFEFPQVYNDIALLRLNERVPFTANILPACIYDQDVPKGTVLTATGRGTTDPEGITSSNELRYVHLKEFDLEECKRTLSEDESVKQKISKGVVSTMICAWNDTADVCMGDSGGPLSFKPDVATKVHNIVGLTSFGPFPCLSSLPNVYTRISKYLDWIECHVWPNVML